MSGGELADSYAAAYNGKLLPGKRPALLLIDMVAAYLDPASPLYCNTAAGALEVAAQMLDAARGARIPIVLTNVVYEPGGADGGLFYRKVPSLAAFDRGSALGAFRPELEPRAGDHVITKQFPSAFFGTVLADWLHEREVDTLVMGGYSTSGCVRASALDALQYGFAPFVVRDACADRHPGPHEANLFDLQAKYAEVVDSERALGIIRAVEAAED